MKINDNNVVALKGEVISDFQFSHEVFGEGFYLFDLKVERCSAVVDILPILVSERLINVKESAIGARVIINGELRSYSKQSGEYRKVILTVFVKEIENVEETAEFDCNEIKLCGFLCKQPVYRKTSLSKMEITDFILAVNRPYGKKDYIPCICWERNARFLAMQPIGTEIEIEGRFQSREYKKLIGEGEYETRTAFEVSVGKLEVVKHECED